jgi:diadenosine tetraphosphate (Ap4A) HIT family hydrolase
MGCVFCAIVAGRAPASVVWEDERFVAFLDIYPVTVGHMLVVPRRHTPLLADLGDDAAALFGHAVRLAGAMRRSGLPCDDLNLVLNDGRAANQTVPHAHVHVVPRRRGDFGTLLRKLLQRPVQRLLGGPARDELDRQAAAIRLALDADSR